MKKRLFRILALTMIISLFAIQGVYAAGQLSVESIFPEDGSKGIQINNQMARIVFSGNIDIDKNKDCFKIVDSSGKEQSILVLEQPDVPNRVNLVLKDTLNENEEFTIIISEDLTDEDGNTLGEEYKTTFKTKSAKTESLVTTGMMVVMFAGIIVFTLRDQAKKAREAAEEEAKSGKKKPEKVNPYKDAKKEAERIRAQKKKEKEMKVREHMRKNEAKERAKKKHK